MVPTRPLTSTASPSPVVVATPLCTEADVAPSESSKWKGPPPGFYGPRDIALGPDNSVYVVDQGNGHIVKLDKSGDLLAILSAGAYTTCYSTVGFNGFAPLATRLVG